MNLAIDNTRRARSWMTGPWAGRTAPTEIDIHHWGIDGQSHDGVVRFFVEEADTSSHYVASAGRVTQLVPDDAVAYASGIWEVNVRALAIECRPEATDADYQTVAELVAYLRMQHGDLPLKPHKLYALTSCPGRWDLDRVDRMARDLQAPPLTEMDIDMATPEQVSEAIMLHPITVDGETMRYQDWIVRLVRNTRGTLKSEQIITAADGKTKAPVKLVLANLGADVRAVKTKTDRLP